MKRKKHYNGNKVSTALMSLTSSILVAIIHEKLFEVTYEVKRINDVTYRIVQDSQYSTRVKVICVIVLYLVIWVGFDFVCSKIAEGIQIRKYRGKPKYRKEDVIECYKTNKKKILLLQKELNESLFLNVDEANEEVLLYLEEMAEIINAMHKIFCSNDKKTQQVVEDIFAGYKSLEDIKSRISPYQYQALLNKIKKMVDCINGEDELLDKDKKWILKKITELELIVKNRAY